MVGVKLYSLTHVGVLLPVTVRDGPSALHHIHLTLLDLLDMIQVNLLLLSPLLRKWVLKQEVLEMSPL